MNVTVELCNVGNRSLPNVHAVLYANATIDGVGETSERFGDLPWGFELTAGSCIVRSREWEPLSAAGDVTIVAIGSTGAFDPNPANDVDTEETFVLLGGFGGVVLAGLVP